MKRIPFLAILLFAISHTAIAQKKQKRNNNDATHFRVAIDGGWSYRTAKISESIPQDQREFLKGLKPGYNIAIEGTYYFNSGLGIGLQFSNFRAGNEASAAFGNNGQIIYGTLSVKTNIQYIGPSFSGRLVFGSADNLYFGGTISLGYMSYDYIEKFASLSASDSRSTFGLTSSLYFDVAVSNSVLLGVKLGSASGSFDVGGSQRESLARIDLSGGIRFRF